jgi:hypothetical protein
MAPGKPHAEVVEFETRPVRVPSLGAHRIEAKPIDETLAH